MTDLLTQPQLTAMTWTMTGAAIMLSAGRYALRYRKAGRFFWDDAAHAVALVTLIGINIEFTVFFPQIYQIDAYSRNQGPGPSPSEYVRFLKFQLSVSIVWWVCMYSVKLSFLLLYRLIFAVSKRLRIAWWAITIFTLVTFWVCIAGELTACGPSKNLFHADKCESKSAKRGFAIVLEYSGVVHVLSDVAIMALPLFVLHSLQIPNTKKAALASIFSLAVLVIIFDIVRSVKSIEGKAVGAQSAFWCILEGIISVYVSCMPAYVALFAKAEKKITHGPTYHELSDYDGWPRTRHTSQNTFRSAELPGKSNSVVARAVGSKSEL